MKKNQLQESLKKLEKAFGENSKNLHSNIANSLNSTIKDLDEATLRKRTYTQDTILELSDSVEYANGLIEKGTTNSLINILMDNPKRVDNFGISIEDLKSLKTIIDIIDRIKQRFGEEKHQDQFVQIIEEISELQKNFKQSNPEKSLGDYIKLIKNISKNENTQKSIIKLIEENQNILKGSLTLLSNMFTNTEVKFSPENSSQLEVTIYVKEGQEKKDGKQVYNSQQFDDEYHKITQAESFLVKKSEEKSKQSAKEQDTNPFGSESESQEIKCKSFFIAHKLIKEIEKITGKINASGWFEKLIDATKFNREILDENKQFVQESDSGILISIKNLEGQKTSTDIVKVFADVKETLESNFEDVENKVQKILRNPRYNGLTFAGGRQLSLLLDYLSKQLEGQPEKIQRKREAESLVSYCFGDNTIDLIKKKVLQKDSGQIREILEIYKSKKFDVVTKLAKIMDIIGIKGETRANLTTKKNQGIVFSRLKKDSDKFVSFLRLLSLSDQSTQYTKNCFFCDF